MDDLDDFAGQIDVAVAVNSLVMPDVRVIDRTLRAIRASLRPGGVFLGVVPSMDAIHYHTMLLMDQALDRGLDPEEAERSAAFHAEHHFYEFAFGRFAFQGLRQKFWQPFEIRHRMAKAGFTSVELDQVLYPVGREPGRRRRPGRPSPELGLVLPGPALKPGRPSHPEATPTEEAARWPPTRRSPRPLKSNRSRRGSRSCSRRSPCSSSIGSRSRPT